ncbi:hypothetical protein [Lactobacillus sp. ESL0228]|uniref:hypothetical protein n=1 Tax=Lactobacillus sp. ESL0228 TaxID=2069352 RepID=UPI000EFACFE6|nr:hypothetical protein [Lactobacillus sp. ESL0228]RMC48896.1 hypothetical protein F5ESL0228_04670 [Lactobacillus sp. ESL0228]
MSEYNKTILTNEGLSLAARANKGVTKFTISKAAASSKKMTDKSNEDLQKLTELSDIVQYGKIIDVADSTQNKGVVIGVGLYFDNQDLTTSYDLNTIGVYAKEEGSDKDILYAITTAAEPETMPDYQNEVLFKFNLTMFIVVGRTDKVTVSVDDSDSATKAELDKVKNELDDKANLTDVYPKNKVDELVAGAGKLKQISVNGGTPISPDSTGTAPLQIPVFAPNLLKGTSNKGQDIPPNVATDIVHLTTLGNTKYTVAVDIDYSSFPSDAAGAELQVNNGGTVIKSKQITAGSKGRVSVTFTTPPDCSWVAFVLSSNSSYVGKYSCLKASQWQDNATPPDMIWLPSPDDTSGVKTIDGYGPDSNGNISLKDTYATISSVNKKTNQVDFEEVKNKLSAIWDGYTKSWSGTLAQYQALSSIDGKTTYYIIDG